MHHIKPKRAPLYEFNGQQIMEGKHTPYTEVFEPVAVEVIGVMVTIN